MRWLVAAAILAIVGSASVPVQAQFFWDQQQYQSKRSRPQSDGFFGNWFNPFNSRPRERDSYSRQRDDDYGPPAHRQYQHTQQPTESSRAPPPRKAEAKGEQPAPATSIVVMGDDMADWLAYGLEDVFSDSPEVRILRKNKLGSGLVRYDSKGDLDWWHVARDMLAQEKADYIVMMLGLGDRGDIREKDIAKEAETRAKEQQAKDQAKDPAKDQSKDEAEKKGNQKSAKTDDASETGTPAAQRSRKTGSAEFRSDEWEKVYSRRIDDTIAALKSKGVPVIWVGLPPIRGARSSGDVAYLNEFYRSRAERAGITYIDVWDGFVDEAGKYSNYGPDYEGQVRRLRLGDGVFFTKAGAIKLARYVEHELSRYMNNRVPVALPSGPVEPSPSEAKPAERPLMGPVVPLTGKPAGTPKDSDELLGGPGSSSIHGDALATKVLAKGETMAAPTGRADNFGWRPNSTPNAAQSAPVAPVAADPKVEAKADPKAPPTAAAALASAPADAKQEEPKKGVEKPARRATKKPKQDEASASSSGSSPTSSSASTSAAKPPRDGIPRPPRPIDASNSSSNGSSNSSWNGSWFGSSNGSRGLFNWSR